MTGRCTFDKCFLDEMGIMRGDAPGPRFGDPSFLR